MDKEAADLTSASKDPQSHWGRKGRKEKKLPPLAALGLAPPPRQGQAALAPRSPPWGLHTSRSPKLSHQPLPLLSQSSETDSDDDPEPAPLLSWPHCFSTTSHPPASGQRSSLQRPPSSPALQGAILSPLFCCMWDNLFLTPAPLK